ncbi:MAG TPA: hypothetical protein H9794_06495 [Candidatus Mediterraneibacter merdigallinarum]|nr:hypothetical protein [Candidatus Mediterraneibacter merdigallinarum]
MNPGIFYLYEYENNKRKRNVGFIKIARRYQTCILQIHIRGISTGNGASLELYAFYRDGNAMTGTQIATLTCFGKTVSERLPVSERSFPEGRPLSEMDGFLIKLPGDKPAVFWMASAFFFPVDISQLRPPAAPEEESETIPAPAPEEEPETVSAPAPDNVEAEDPGNTEAPVPESNRESSESPSVFSDGISGQERESAAEDREYRKEKKKARKIQRSDISVLPRRFWFLANNSFLLHGYHNYNHLLLAEEDGRLWLGVPGIYDPREAKVADLFGFPQFTREYADCLELEPEECSDNADFGYWCRCVGAGRIG